MSTNVGKHLWPWISFRDVDCPSISCLTILPDLSAGTSHTREAPKASCTVSYPAQDGLPTRTAIRKIGETTQQSTRIVSLDFPCWTQDVSRNCIEVHLSSPNSPTFERSINFADIRWHLNGQPTNGNRWPNWQLIPFAIGSSFSLTYHQLPSIKNDEDIIELLFTNSTSDQSWLSLPKFIQVLPVAASTIIYIVLDLIHYQLQPTCYASYLLRPSRWDTMFQ